MNILLYAHSGLRWLIVATAVILIGRLVSGWLREREFGALEKRLTLSFSGLIDVQVALGLVYFFWTGATGAGYPRYRIEHMTTMLIAAAVAHLPSVWKRSGDRIRYRNTLFAALGSLLLIAAGVARLPGGWSQ